MRTIIAGMFIMLEGVIEAPEKWNPSYYDEELSRLNGTGTSRRTAYALPPGEAVTEFRRALRVSG